jgi:MFS transporter, DHA1 family, multidrug resistance protein
MWLRLPETLKPENRHAFSFADTYKSLTLVLSNRQTLGHTFSAGLIFGCLISYLNCARQIFQDYYDTGHLFVFYFAISALSIGLASVVNSSIVRRYGMHKISHLALTSMIVIALVFLPFALTQPGNTPFIGFILFSLLSFFCLGLLFGNLNAMAMEPMGHQAGVASSVIGALTSAISLLVGSIVGQLFDMTLIPLVSGFLILSVSGLAIQLLLARETVL